MKNTANLVLLLIVTILLIGQTESRIFSRSKPQKYKLNDTIPVYANNIKSGLSQYGYYGKAPFPKPNSIESKESFQFRLSGNRKSSSLYQLNVTLSNQCKPLQSQYTSYSIDEVKTFKQLIEDDYRVNLYIDDLPLAENFTTHLYLGYPIGYKYHSGNFYYALNNHLDITILYSSVEQYKVESSSDELRGDQEYYIVGVSVSPSSCNHTLKTLCVSCEETLLVDENLPLTVQWSYNVTSMLVNSPDWTERWNDYYVQTDLQGVSVGYNAVLIVFISATMAIILFKIFRKTTFGLLGEEETGWKSIYGDVFRSPNNFMTFSVIVGFGIQIVAGTFILMVFSVAGFLSIANQGGMALATILIFAFSSLFNGYSSMRTYIMMGGTRKRYNTYITSTLLPLIFLILMGIGNIPVWSHKYTYAPTTGAVFFVLAMWLFVSLPFSAMSSYFVYTWPPSEYPCKTHTIPRLIPKPKWYQNPYISMAIGFTIPFIMIYAELYFFLSSLVLGEHYSYSFSFCISFIFFIITIIEINFITEYYQLSIENYNWWWRSLLGPAITGLYVFIYFIIFGISNISVDGVWFYYFFYSLIFSLLVSFFCSSIGFLGNLYLTKRIYSTLHFE
ncbi:hypothetical protein CYY_000060 [Polysphondylium violaceum]|uniref:Transmembrane 9 superfamily member n=1 Tax=Polysphondylium violaceum TaxID=133409 RepID=A0A8J4VBZ0_9MYCE|nr:hypothetical protein CYY_000060 [Polysphondylium violaceum]